MKKGHLMFDLLMCKSSSKNCCLDLIDTNDNTFVVEIMRMLLQNI